MLRRILTAAALVVVMTLGAVAVASGHRGSDRFDDVPRGHYADEEIGWAVDQDITRGVSRYRFDPDGTVTRAQIVTFLYRLDRLWEEGQPRDLTDVYEEMDDLEDDVKDLTENLRDLERRFANLDNSGYIPPDDNEAGTPTTRPNTDPIQEVRCPRGDTAQTVKFTWEFHAAETSIPVNHAVFQASLRNAAGKPQHSAMVVNDEEVAPYSEVELEVIIAGVEGASYSHCEVRRLSPSSTATSTGRKVRTVTCPRLDADTVTVNWVLTAKNNFLLARHTAFQAYLRHGSQTLYSDIILGNDVTPNAEDETLTTTIEDVTGAYSNCRVRAFR